MDIQVYLDVILKWFINSGLPIIIVLVWVVATLKIIKFIIQNYFARLIKADDNPENAKRANTLRDIIKSTFDILTIIIGLLIILNRLGVDLGPILATAGVLGIAISFGAQRFIEDIITGIIILTEDQIRVGDVVKIADKGGLVEKVDLKMVVLRDLSGNVHYIRNGKIDVITNMTKDFSRYVFDIGVAYRENIDEVIEIIKQVDEELRNDVEMGSNILEPIEILGLDRFDDSAQVIRARIKTKPIKQWEIGRAFNARLKKKFDENNIEIPFPHRTIYFGQEKDGTAPPMNVNIDNNES